MSTNHNRIKVADLEINEPNKTLITNENGELEFSNITGGSSQDLQSVIETGSFATLNSGDKVTFEDADTFNKTKISGNRIEINTDDNGEQVILSPNELSFYKSDNSYVQYDTEGIKYTNDDGGLIRLAFGDIINDNDITLQVPSNLTTGTYTLATLEDINDNFIHKTGEVTEIIDGSKIFRFPTTFRGDASASYIKIDSDYLTFITEAHDNNSIKLTAKQNSGAENENFTQELQAKSGVIALLNDFKTINGVSVVGTGNIVTSSIASGIPNTLSKYNSAGNNLVNSNITDNGSTVAISKPTEINSGIANTSGLKFTNLKFQSDYSYSTFAAIPLYGNGIVKDSNNNLFVSAGSTPTITKITPAGTASTFATIPSWSICLTIDSNNNIFTGGSTGIINKITSAGTVSTFLNAGGQVINIIVDKNDNIYFAKQVDNKIYKLTPSGILSTFSTLAGYVYGLYINDNYFYATDNQNNTVSKISLSGTILNTYSTGPSPRFVITTDSGIIYTANFNNSSSGTITKILPDGTITTIASGVSSGYTRMDKDENGNIYVATTGYGIVKVSPDDTAQFLYQSAGRTTAIIYVNSTILSVNADSSSITKFLLPEPQKPLTVDANGNIVFLNNVGFNAPISSTDTGTKGEVRITSEYIYWCVATNVWVRTSVSSF